MIDKIASVSLYVRDQDKALEFYTKLLGFETRRDEPMGGDMGDARWIEVAPAGAGTTLVLYKSGSETDRVGVDTNMILNTTDIASDYAALKERGVVFDHEPKSEFWGTFTNLRDPDGNAFLLIQAAPFTPPSNS